MNLRLPPLACFLALLASGGEPNVFVAAAAIDDENLPCKVHQRAGIMFPYRALAEGIVHGEAQLMLDVDRYGQLADVLAVAYTRREFADAALEAVRQWRFTPARIAGEPAGATIRLSVQFEVAGVLAYVKPIGSPEKDPVFGDRFIYQPFSLGALDRVPAAVAQPGPLYPKEWIAQGRTGMVNVEFYIDEDGRVRFPRILSQADAFLGAASLAAVREWRFNPPLHKGRPVLAQATQVFHFDPPTRAPAR